MKILAPLKVPLDPETAKISIRLAKIIGAELEFLNVVDTTPFKGHIKVQDEVLKHIREDGEDLLKRAVEMAENEGVKAKAKLVEGKPYDAILEEEQDADMLVLKIRRFSGAKTVGSVTKDMLEQCRKPIFIFKGEEREFKEILLAIDESVCSREAMNFSMSFAKYLGLKAISTIFVARSSEKMDIGKIVLNDAKERGEGLGIDVETHLEKGNPAKELLKLSEGFDLIIMGAVGQGTLSKFFLGNVARKVANLSKCDVIVVPPCK